ncbi:MAG: DUF4476 domain-containing protein [Bacteroidales bacterium]|nr:DUF4476 domain-containing protein [Bacteroidales bacterium]
MKIILFSISFILMIFNLKAQNSNMIVFSEQGETFYLVINGVKQNQQPQTNVKVTGLNADAYQVKIIFEKTLTNQKEFDKNIYFNTKGEEYTYSIKLNKKGLYALKYVSQVPLAQAPQAVEYQTEVAYSESPVEETQTNTTTITTTTNSQNVASNSDVNMQVNVGEQDMGMNVNMTINGVPTGSSDVTYTETTTTTTSTTVSSSSYGYDETEDDVDEYEVHQGNEHSYHGRVGCHHPMSQSNFNSAKSSIESKDFEDSKLTIAKQIVDANCLTSEQVKSLMELFTYESSKLEIAKYCYKHTYDVENYYKVNDAFGFESSIDELNDFIKK